MIFETVKSEGLAHFSYLLGDPQAGTCVVIDPRRDVDVYLDLAQRNQVRITTILETHIHADFISGSRELAARTGASIGAGATGDYGFEVRPLHEDDTLEVGPLTLRVLHTPGHTPEHVCFLVSGGQGAEAPWGLFTGDTLFAGDLGRPDLLGDGQEEQLARQLYDSLHDKIFPLADAVEIYPAHGEGSPCGASIGGRPTSTIGYERQQNPLLQIEDPGEFVEQLLAEQMRPPEYYPRMKEINAAGPQVLGTRPHLPALSVEAFKRAAGSDDTVVLDTREIVAFGGAHIPGAINIALRPAFPIWAGRILRPEQRLLLLLPEGMTPESAQIDLLRVGLERIEGYLAGGMRSWIEGGEEFAQMPQLSVHDLHRRLQEGADLQILDVRDDQEWQEGYIPTAQHIFVPDLLDNLDRLDRRHPVAVYCGSGFRASIAGSLLLRNGFDDVANIPGSITAWQAAGYPEQDGSR